MRKKELQNISARKKNCCIDTVDDIDQKNKYTQYIHEKLAIPKL